MLEHPITGKIYLIDRMGVEIINIEESAPITRLLFNKPYNKLNKEELKLYREYLKK